MIRTAASLTLAAGLLGGVSALAAPSDPDEFLRRATELFDAGKYRPAEALVNEVILADKSRADAFLLRGMIRVERNNGEGAIVDLGQALRLGLRGAQGPYLAYSYRGRAAALVKDYDGAEKDFASALKFATTNREKAAVHYLRGQSRSAEGKPRDALTDLTAAIDLDPNRRAYYEARAEVYRKLGMDDRARMDAAKAASLK